MVCPLFRLAAILLLVPCVANAADNWPAFRGPHGDGHADATGLPITFGETENVRWRTPIAGKAWSSPVVWGEQVWVTNATVDGKELSALCLNRNTGKIEKEIASKLKAAKNTKPDDDAALDSTVESHRPMPIHTRRS